MTIEIKLTEDELKKIKKGFKDGGVMTDGCFCGRAVAHFRDHLYVYIDFSCRKSSLCESSYYDVHAVYITEPALLEYDEETVWSMLKNETFGEEERVRGRKFILTNDDYSDERPEDLHFVCEGLVFDEESLKKVQKKLFKYYKKTYGHMSDAKFKDVGQFKY